jgi:uncharacterized protein (DUF983 family)
MSFFQSLSRGFHCRCPSCGEGHLFRAFLKVRDKCEACGEEFHHHNADDLPAYLVVFFVGHVMLSVTLWMEVAFKPDYWIYAAILLPAGGAMTFGLLQPVKGAVVALQWHMGMDGFAPARTRRLAKATPQLPA